MVANTTDAGISCESPLVTEKLRTLRLEKCSLSLDAATALAKFFSSPSSCVNTFVSYRNNWDVSLWNILIPALARSNISSLFCLLTIHTHVPFFFDVTVFHSSSELPGHKWTLDQMQQLDAELEKNKNTTLVSFHESSLFSQVFWSTSEHLSLTCVFIHSISHFQARFCSFVGTTYQSKCSALLCSACLSSSDVTFHGSFPPFSQRASQNAFLSAFIPSPNNESPLASLQLFPHLMREIVELMTPSWVHDKHQKDVRERERAEQSRHTLSL